MKVTGYSCSDVGRVRSENEDSFLVDDENGLYIVCDGLGGHAAGKFASETTVTHIAEYLSARLPQTLSSQPWHDHHARTIAVIQGALREAGAHLIQLAQQNQELSGMGTTATVVKRIGNKLVMAHVGDSRLYLFRRGELHQLSKDHTVAQELYDHGVLTADQALHSPHAHILTRSIGQIDVVIVDTLCFELLPGDICLLCSDGFSNAIDDNEELVGLLESAAPEQLVHNLVNLAKEKDGSDNITVVMIEACEGDEEKNKERQRQESVYLQLDTLRQIILFQDLSLTELLKVMDHVTLLECDPGWKAISEGDIDQSLYVIISGTFSVDTNGTRLTELSPGSHFGEMALVGDEPRSATVTAISAAQILTIKREDFLSIIKDDSGLGVKMLWRLGEELVKRLARANQKLGDFSISHSPH